MKYVDLTHMITHNMPVFPGDVPVELQPTAIYAQHGVANHSLCGSLHMGTHIDAPGHFTERDKKITDFQVPTFFGKAVVIDVYGKQEIGIDSIYNKITKDDIVLFYTGFDKQFYQEHYFYDYPVIQDACAQYLVDKKVKMIGVDFPSVDKAPYKIHKLLLNHDILIIENLTNIEALLDYNNVEIVALPLKIDGHGAPARVVAINPAL